MKHPLSKSKIMLSHIAIILDLLKEYPAEERIQIYKEIFKEFCPECGKYIALTWCKCGSNRG